MQKKIKLVASDQLHKAVCESLDQHEILEELSCKTCEQKPDIKCSACFCPSKTKLLSVDLLFCSAKQSQKRKHLQEETDSEGLSEQMVRNVVCIFQRISHVHYMSNILCCAAAKPDP